MKLLKTSREVIEIIPKINSTVSVWDTLPNFENMLSTCMIDWLELHVHSWDEPNKRIPNARGTTDQDTSSVIQVELGGPMTRARAKKFKESMQTLVRTIHDGFYHANVIHELEKEETIRYTLV